MYIDKTDWYLFKAGIYQSIIILVWPLTALVVTFTIKTVLKARTDHVLQLFDPINKHLIIS